jgi:transcriptional regulator
MLYNPPAFKVAEIDVLHDHIDRAGLVTLVSVGAEGPLVSHLPLLLDRRQGNLGRLVGHLARPNPQLKQSDLSREAVAIFQGPDAYVSPTWYASKREHGRVVPTWNYAVVHARGRLTLFDDPDRLLAVVRRLTERHEAGIERPWSVNDAPKEFIAAQLKGIVGIELMITSLEGKHKLSQNRPAADQEGVIVGLKGRGDVGDRAVAEMMERYGGKG